MKNSVNAKLEPITGEGYLKRKLAAQREKLVDAFLEFKGSSTADTILNVGLTPAAPVKNASSLQPRNDTPMGSAITSCNIVVSHAAPWRYAGPEPIRSDQSIGQKLPFRDGQFDWVFCSEVIEHAGSNAHQLGLLRELARVAQKGIFVTTVNKRHPIEFNTGLPFLHWLPEGLWRGQLRLLGKGEWASECILNPVGSDTLQAMAAQLPHCISTDIGHLRIAGIKAHFFMMIRKEELPRQSMSEQKRAGGLG